MGDELVGEIQRKKRRIKEIEAREGQVEEPRRSSTEVPAPAQEIQWDGMNEMEDLSVMDHEEIMGEMTD